MHNKQEMSLKKTNGVGLKKEEIYNTSYVKYLYINLTQIAENLK